MRSSEGVCLLYFTYLSIVPWLRPLSSSRRLQVTGVSLVTIAALLLIRSAPVAVRDWAPLAYIGVGYYLTGRLFIRPSLRLERWLMGWDHRLFGDPTTRFAAWPGWLLAYLDTVYTFCFLMLPGGFAALALTGRSAYADHYWTMVAAADLAAFAPLSVFQTRPPWALERRPTLGNQRTHGLADFMVRHATIGANTFPSGHVAVSIAMALALMGPMPALGITFLVLALSIGVACVVGRYHYAPDAVAGLLLGLAVAALAAWFGV